MKAFSFCLAVFAASIPSHAAVSDDEKEILRLENVLTEAWLKRDLATIGHIVADEYQSWSFKGTRRGKADLLRTVEKSQESDTHSEDAVVRIYGDTAVYTARIIDTISNTGGQSAPSRTCVTQVFVRRAGKWQLVASQDTLL